MMEEVWGGADCSKAGNDTRLEGDHSDGRAFPAASSTDQAWREPLPQEQSQAGRFLFFARVPPAVPYDELLALFNKYGTVLDLNLYRRWASAKTSKGCGLVEFCAPSKAQAAMEALNGVFKFDGYQQEAPMVVEWMDAGRMAPPGAAKPTAAKPKKTPTSKAQPQSKAAPKPDNAAARITGSNTNSTMSSNSNRHFGAIHAWQRAQQLFALMQQQQQQSQAAAANAAAAAAACYAARVPPPGPFNPYASLDAAGLAAAMMRQQASPAGAGLGAPPNLSGDTLLPMTYTNPPATVFMGWSALIPQHSAGMGLPGASGAAAAAAAAAQALSPNSGVNSLDLLTRAGLSPLPGYSAPCSEAFPLLSPLAGACTSACSPHPLGPGLHPLLLPDDCSFARDTFMSGMQQAGIGGQTGAGRGLSASMSMFTHSDSFSVFPDSSATLTLAQLQERAGMSRSSAVCPSPSPSVAWASNSGILSAPAMLTGADVWSSYDGSTHVGSLSGALSGRLQGLLRQGSMHGRQQAAARDNGPVALEDCLMPPAAPEQAMVAMGLCRLGSFGITPDQMLANPLSPTSRPFGL